MLRVVNCCQAVGCGVQINEGLFLCRPHWDCLPFGLQAGAKVARRASEAAGRLTGGYYMAQRECVAELALLERRWKPEQVDVMRPKWRDAAARLDRINAAVRAAK